ncbi:MAG: adenylate kinase [Parcubacteria group bacterium]|nr:adenylate kinase [Parcubacteria group bacterium]
MSTSHLFVFMGRPGAGKGVQSEFLSKHTGFPIFSTGSEVRRIAAMDTLLGKKIAEVSNAGGLTPFWFASYLFEKSLFELKDNEGQIFEGVGRKVAEAQLFHDINTWIGRDYKVIYLDVSEKNVTDRLEKRRAIGGREDDKGDKLKNRFDHYDAETMPALEYFRSVGKVIEINGEPDPETVFKEVLEKIELYL